MKEFNWNEFKKEKIAVHCNTMQGTKDFINKCYENNIDWCDASKSETLSFLCKHYNSNRYFDFDCHSLEWDEKSFYSDRGYKIIEWDKR